VLWVAMTLGVIRIPVSVSMRVRSSRLPNESRPWSESPSPKAEQTIALIGSPGQGAYRNIIWHTGKLRHAQAGERLGGGRDAPRRAVGRIEFGVSVMSGAHRGATVSSPRIAHPAPNNRSARASANFRVRSSCSGWTLVGGMRKPMYRSRYSPDPK